MLMNALRPVVPLMAQRTACLTRLSAISSLLLLAGLSSPARAAAEAQSPPALEEKDEETPIATELAQALVMLDNQITEQQGLVKTAQTEGERTLITNHIRFLQKEQGLLRDLLDELVGPHYDIREAAREQQSEYRSGQSEKILEQDQRFPSP